MTDAGSAELTTGARVRAARNAIRMTQERLAEKAGVSVDYIRRIEGGTRPNPSARVLARLARALNVDVNTLLDTRAPAPLDPWLVKLAARLDALPLTLRQHARAVIEELMDALASPYVAFAAQLNELLGATTELSEAELQEVAEYALALAQGAPEAAAAGEAPAVDAAAAGA